MISIVLSTFNSMKYLEELVNSLINQTEKNYEVIICDDCSTDNTVDFLKEFIVKNKLSKWKIYSNESNLGYVKNFAKGISLSQGEYIFLCDHDDIWLPNKLEIVLNLFKKSEKYKLIGSSFEIIDALGKKKPAKNSFFLSNNGIYKYHVKKNKIENISFKKLFTYSFTPGCCMAFRKEAKDEIVQLLNVAPHDYLISCYFAAQRGAYFLNMPLIQYRIHGENTIGLADKSSIDERIRLCQRDYLEKEDVLNSLMRSGQLNKSNYKYAKKLLKLIELRKSYLMKRSKLKLLFLFVRTIFMKKYWLTIAKDFILIQ